mmetsp:Transcript_4210/g.14732  ORF Transcript_4210/g.14732 Transcript_4210/m.14732 type:complete len:220 (+) Transcript_4210:672-1331(+)
MHTFGGSREAPRKLMIPGWCRRLSRKISFLNVSSILEPSVMPCMIFTATSSPLHVALCTVPNPPEPKISCSWISLSKFMLKTPSCGAPSSIRTLGPTPWPDFLSYLFTIASFSPLRSNRSKSDLALSALRLESLLSTFPFFCCLLLTVRLIATATTMITTTADAANRIAGRKALSPSAAPWSDSSTSSAIPVRLALLFRYSQLRLSGGWAFPTASSTDA